MENTLDMTTLRGARVTYVVSDLSMIVAKITTRSHERTLQIIGLIGQTNTGPLCFRPARRTCTASLPGFRLLAPLRIDHAQLALRHVDVTERRVWGLWHRLELALMFTHESWGGRVVKRDAPEA